MNFVIVSWYSRFSFRVPGVSVSYVCDVSKTVFKILHLRSC